MSRDSEESQVDCWCMRGQKTTLGPAPSFVCNVPGRQFPRIGDKRKCILAAEGSGPIVILIVEAAACG